MKLLFVANYPNQPSGYARIAHKLSEFFASFPDTTVYYFGFNNFQESCLWDIVPNPKIQYIDVIEEEKKIQSTEIFGRDIILSFMEKIQPDVLFLYNDIVVICNLFNSLLAYKQTHNYKTITYLDLVYEYEKPEFICHVDRNSDFVFVFSECWKRHLIQVGISSDKLAALYHGLNETTFYPSNTIEARKSFGISDDDFVILNTNNNSYRKAHDISIRAFLQFLKINDNSPHIKLFINCVLNTKPGYDIMTLIEVECMRLNMSFHTIVTTNIIISKNIGKMSDSDLNMLYNACDIGINTAVGEGFGLCNLEHASVGKPQIVTATGALVDIFTSEQSMLVKPIATLYVPNHMDCHGGIMDICRSEDFADAMNNYYHNTTKRLSDGKNIATHIRGLYSWENILTQFKIQFDNVILC